MNMEWVKVLKRKNYFKGMKRLFRIILLSSLIFNICSCGKEDDQTFHLYMNENDGEKYHFTPSDTLLYPCWDAGDSVRVNGSGPYGIVLHDNHHASFQYSGPQSTSSFRIFVFGDGSNVTYTSPNSRYYFQYQQEETISDINSNQRLRIPMGGYVAGENRNVNMKLAGAVIAFKACSPGVTKITIESSQNISGSFYCNISSENATVNDDASTTNNHVTRKININNENYGSNPNGDFVYVGVPRINKGTVSFSIKKNGITKEVLKYIPNKLENGKVYVVNLDNLLASGTKGMESPFEYSYEL